MKIKHLESKPLSILLFIIMLLMFSTVYMTKTMFSSAMATIVEEGVMTKSQTGLISGAYWLVYGIFQVFGGFAADKYSPSKLIIIGISGAILTNVIIYLYPVYPVIMGAWMFNAAIQFGVWPSTFKIIFTELKEDFRATAIFWFPFSTSIGLAMSMLVASFVSNWLDNFLVSVISLSAVLIMWIAGYGLISRKMVREGILKTHTSKPEHPTHVADLKFVLLKTGLLAIIIVSFFRTAVDNGIKMLTPVMLMESYTSIPAAIATRMSIILVVFAAIGVFITGFIRKKITTNEAKGSLCLLIPSIPVLVVALFVGKLHYIIILACLSLTVSFTNGMFPLLGSFAAMRFNAYGRGGFVSGIVNATAAAGNIVASYVFARIAEFAPWSSVIFIWIISIVISIILCISILSLWTRFINKNEAA